MMKKAGMIVAVAALFLSSRLFAQDKFYTKNGKISFFSSTSVENIAAVNKSTVCLLNSKTGELQFAVLLKGFEFKKALMQEHFNSDYVESDKYPKSEFKGEITNNGTVVYTGNGTYPVNVKGKLMIHGVTKDVEAAGTVITKDGTLVLNSTFNILLADYQVTVPKLYTDNISKSIKVSVDCALDPLK
jgi:YceI-like domain